MSIAFASELHIQQGLEIENKEQAVRKSEKKQTSLGGTALGEKDWWKARFKGFLSSSNHGFFFVFYHFIFLIKNNICLVDNLKSSNHAQK